MKWGDIKIESLRKMFSSEGKTINISDEAVREYILAMPQAANEALNLLCLQGKALRKKFEFSTGGLYDLPSEIYDFNPLGNEMEVYAMTDAGAVPIPGANTFGRYLSIPNGFKGDGVLFYDALPPTITQDTPDSFNISLDSNADAYIPLYIAGELYKDDDITISTQYLNEFERFLETLQNRSGATLSGDFSGITGWT